MSVAVGERLANLRGSGRKLLVCYLMADSTPDWLDAAHALVDAGADALEVGVAFSDPLIDGPVIQEAGTRALAKGATLRGAVDALADAALDVPVLAMTYLNVFAHPGYAASCAQLAAGGVRGVIVPDLPLAELDAWHAAAQPHGIETVLLAAPSTSPTRLQEIAARSEGFVYAVGRMAVTGERAELDPAGDRLVAALRTCTQLPVCLGVGVSTPPQAHAAVARADGVVVGSAIVRRMLDGAAPKELCAFVRSLREAIDGGAA